jgi:hypothetical protein
MRDGTRNDNKGRGQAGRMRGFAARLENHPLEISLSLYTKIESPAQGRSHHHRPKVNTISTEIVDQRREGRKRK